MMGNGSVLLEKKNNSSCVSDEIELVNHADPKLLEKDHLLENKLANPRIDIELTPREKEILELILAGHTNRVIARKLYRTERTIEYHRNRLMRKLGTRSTVDLVKCAIAMGMA